MKTILTRSGGPNRMEGMHGQVVIEGDATWGRLELTDQLRTETCECRAAPTT